MTCHEYDALLAHDLEGDLSAEERASVETHLRECARCRGLRAELVAIAAAARDLPVMSPSRDLWDGIAARIDAPVTALGATPHSVARRRPIWLVAAAAALVVATAGTTYVITKSSVEGREAQVAVGGPAGVLPGSPNVGQPGEIILTNAQEESNAAFDREVVQLRPLLEERRPNLDSATVALLERNLQIIDRAIAESRAALEKDPGSALLSRQLHNALGKKVQVLRTAALLPVETN
jgi:hypothetical protein